MLPYGFKHGDYKDENWAPTSKHAPKLKKRKSHRQLLHKKARHELKRDLERRIDDNSSSNN